VEDGFRQLKDPHVVSFSPMRHWTDHMIRVHVFYCVLALTIVHLMRRGCQRPAALRPDRQGSESELWTERIVPPDAMAAVTSVMRVHRH
jgi:hypothetical protein